MAIEAEGHESPLGWGLWLGWLALGLQATAFALIIVGVRHLNDHCASVEWTWAVVAGAAGLLLAVIDIVAALVWMRSTASRPWRVLFGIAGAIVALLAMAGNLFVLIEFGFVCGLGQAL